MGDVELTIEFPWIFAARTALGRARAVVIAVAVGATALALWASIRGDTLFAMAALAIVLGALVAMDRYLQRTRVVRWGLDVSAGVLRIDYGGALFATARSVVCDRDRFKQVRVRALRGALRELEVEFVPGPSPAVTRAPLGRGAFSDGPELLKLARQIEVVLGRAEAGDADSSEAGA